MLSCAIYNCAIYCNLRANFGFGTAENERSKNLQNLQNANICKLLLICQVQRDREVGVHAAGVPADERAHAAREHGDRQLLPHGERRGVDFSAAASLSELLTFMFSFGATC